MRANRLVLYVDIHPDEPPQTSSGSSQVLGVTDLGFHPLRLLFVANGTFERRNHLKRLQPKSGHGNCSIGVSPSKSCSSCRDLVLILQLSRQYMAVHGNQGQLLQSFLPGAETSPFSMQNLPFGIFSTQRQRDRRAGVAISDQVLDLRAVSRAGLFTGPILSKSAGPGGCFDEVRSEAALHPVASPRQRHSACLLTGNPQQLCSTGPACLERSSPHRPAPAQCNRESST